MPEHTHAVVVGAVLLSREAVLNYQNRGEVTLPCPYCDFTITVRLKKGLPIGKLAAVPSILALEVTPATLSGFAISQIESTIHEKVIPLLGEARKAQSLLEDENWVSALAVLKLALEPFKEVQS